MKMGAGIHTVATQKTPAKKIPKPIHDDLF